MEETAPIRSARSARVPWNLNRPVRVTRSRECAAEAQPVQDGGLQFSRDKSFSCQTPTTGGAPNAGNALAAIGGHGETRSPAIAGTGISKTAAAKARKASPSRCVE